jgi:hypothetical protein
MIPESITGMLVIEPSPGKLSGDAGLLPLRQFDQSIGLTRKAAELRKLLWRPAFL